ncbi:uncharacterized protein V1510DRAFT_411911 [Dipodascopsis tothii]|uniref:uncharacterized protein n=1 Tax=Dipodascopsis tothii TaxID=44089 RepID=UPI0034CDBF59
MGSIDTHTSALAASSPASARVSTPAALRAPGSAAGPDYPPDTAPREPGATANPGLAAWGAADSPGAAPGGSTPSRPASRSSVLSGVSTTAVKDGVEGHRRHHGHYGYPAEGAPLAGLGSHPQAAAANDQAAAAAATQAKGSEGARGSVRALGAAPCAIGVTSAAVPDRAPDKPGYARSSGSSKDLRQYLEQTHLRERPGSDKLRYVRPAAGADARPTLASRHSQASSVNLADEDASTRSLYGETDSAYSYAASGSVSPACTNSSMAMNWNDDSTNELLLSDTGSEYRTTPGAVTPVGGSSQDLGAVAPEPAVGNKSEILRSYVNSERQGGHGQNMLYHDLQEYRNRLREPEPAPL